jgi:hypothetical protein
MHNNKALDNQRLCCYYLRCGRGRSISPIPKGSGYLTLDELQELVKEMPRSPIPDWMKPQVEKWGKEQETEGRKTRFAEIEANWRSCDEQKEPE